jgi:hypothetical protein
MSLFEAATRVPLLIRTPWLPHSVGAVSSSVVELVSLYRTVVELAGMDPASIESSVQGRSFAALVKGGGGIGASIETSATAARVATAATPSDETSVRPGSSQDKSNGESYALSQMTRCGNGDPQTSVYIPCTKTKPTKSSNYTYMGYSVRR